METFKIEGGVPLKGEITPQGAKNEALQILCAVLLTPEKVTINNIPDIIERFHNLDKEQDRTRKDQSFFVPVQEIIDNDYDILLLSHLECQKLFLQ